MSRIPGIRRYFRREEHHPDIEGDVDAELRFHIEMRIEELVARGVAPDAARREALRRFGDVERTREGLHSIDRERLDQERRAEWWGNAVQDLRYALRGLRKQPGFAAVVVLTLGLGVGANATMFGIIDQLLFRPPAHVTDAHEVKRLFFAFTSPARGETVRQEVSFPFYLDLARDVDAFERTAASFTTEIALGRGTSARLVTAVLATASYLPTLGVRPAAGRSFSVEEDRAPSGSPVALVSTELADRELGGATAAIGRTVDAGTKRYEVIGVLPRGFTGVDMQPVDLVLPLSVGGLEIVGKEWHSDRTVSWLQVMGRLRDDAPAEQAAAQGSVPFAREHLSWQRNAADSASALRAQAHVIVAPVLVERGPQLSQNARVSTWLAGVSLVVLLIACANVANLLLARAMRRRREIAALGAMVGFVLAHWGGKVIRSTLFPRLALETELFDGRVMAFAALAALLTGVLTGLAPALQASRPNLVGALKAGAREGSFQRSRTRTMLLVAQAALSVVLLVGAGLFVRSLRNVQGASLGFDPRRVLFVEMSTEGVYERDEALRLYERLYERLRTLPGAASASLAMTTPFYSRINPDLFVPGLDSVPELPSGSPYINMVTPDYFATMGTRILRGRGFTDADAFGAPRVALVNETMARVLWPGQDPIGKCFRVDADTVPCSEVVGVTEEVRWSEVRAEPTMQFYVPMAQKQVSFGLRTLLVRASGDANALAPLVRREVQAMAPSIAFVNVRSLQTLIDPQVRSWRLGATLFSVFGVLALVLASVGLYSVIAYTVAQRTHEMGVRVALGARASDVMRLVVGEGLRVVMGGLALGIGIALAAGGSLESLLFEVSPRSPAVFGVVGLTLLVVAVVASVVPAWRATRVDPNVALRAD